MKKATYHVLTDKEVEVLREVIKKLNFGGNQVNRAPVRVREFLSPPAPEAYVARPQDEEGIPALVRGGTYDVPGKALCDIFMITENADGDPEIRPIAEYAHEVYNITTSVISKDWVQVTRSKDGRWIAVAATGNALFMAILRAPLAAGGGPVNIEKLDDDRQPYDPPQYDTVWDGFLATGSLSTGAIVLVQAGDSKNYTRGVACVQEEENP